VDVPQNALSLDESSSSSAPSRTAHADTDWLPCLTATISLREVRTCRVARTLASVSVNNQPGDFYVYRPWNRTPRPSHHLFVSSGVSRAHPRLTIIIQ